MVKISRTVKAQGISAEYVLMIFVVIAAIITMTTYVRRTIQGRIRDADMLMVMRAAGASGNAVQIEYEPYYVNSVTAVQAGVKEEEKTVTAGRQKDINTDRRVNANSEQLAPKDAM